MPESALLDLDCRTWEVGYFCVDTRQMVEDNGLARVWVAYKSYNSSILGDLDRASSVFMQSRLSLGYWMQSFGPVRFLHRPDELRWGQWGL